MTPKLLRPSQSVARGSSYTSVGRVLDAVLTFGAEDLTQKQVAELAQVSEGTVTRTKACWPGHGPLLTSKPVAFTSELGLVLAVSVGAERIRAGLVDANGIIHCKRVSSPQRGQLKLSQGDLLQLVRLLIGDVLEEALDNRLLRRSNGSLPVFAAALALPTPIDRDHRQVNSALSDESWRRKDRHQTLNHAFASTLGPRFSHATAQVMNDCNAAAVALAFDRVRTYELPRKSLEEPFRQRATAMVVRAGGGVGCGIVEIAWDPNDVCVSRFLKSRVMVGTNALAGEIGHMPISESAVALLNDRSANFVGLAGIDYNAKCACGQPHHLQALMGRAAIAKRLGMADRGDDALTFRLERVFELGGGDEHKAATRALKDAGLLLGRALVGPVLALDLKAITVIGTLARDEFVQGLSAARNDWAKAFHTGLPVQLVSPGDDADWMVARGAGLALMREFRHRQFRQIGRGESQDLLPLLNLRANYVRNLRVGEW